MTGPEHYREAERLAHEADRHITEHPGDMRIAEVSAWAAQVHATLALAAATGCPSEYENPEEIAWHGVAGSGGGS